MSHGMRIARYRDHKQKNAEFYQVVRKYAGYAEQAYT